MVDQAVDQPVETPPSAMLARLRDMDGMARARQSLVPAAVVKQEEWQGLAFVVDGVRVMAAMSEIRELLPYPAHLTVVPGAKEWMIGLANIRGELLPVVDLQRFLGGAACVVSDATRIMVVRNRGMSTGLLVPGVLGMRSMPVDRFVRDSYVDGHIGFYVYDLFQMDDGIWPVFSMAALFADTRFLVASA